MSSVIRSLVPRRAFSTSSSSVNWDSPLSAGGLKLKNRVVMAPTTRSRGQVPGDMQANFYRQRATAGLIIAEATQTSPQGYEHSNAPLIWAPAHVKGWRKVTNAVHEDNGLIVLQVNHIGRVAHPLLQGGTRPIAPSAIAAAGGAFRQISKDAPWVDHDGNVHTKGTYVQPQAVDDPETIVAEFAHGFRNAKEAGFDGIEIHGANGYLVHQFLDSSSNQRTDAWGGSPQKRTKFALRLVEEASKVFGADRVGIRLSPSGGYNDMGMPREETLATFGHLLKELSTRGLAYVHLLRWIPLLDPAKRGTPIEHTEFRKDYKGTWIVNGGFGASDGLQELQNGNADAVAYGRAFMSTPDLTYRLVNKLPFNALDFTTFYTPGPNGYLTYKHWKELSDEEKAKLK